jgi:hypothetical protein
MELVAAGSEINSGSRHAFVRLSFASNATRLRQSGDEVADGGDHGIRGVLH